MTTHLMPNNDNGRLKGPEELELEKQAAMAKLRNEIAQGQADSQKAIAEAGKATVQAQKEQVKGPDITALAGNITSDGTFVESRILARKSLKAAFAALGKSMKSGPVFQNKHDIRLVICNAADLSLIELYVGLKTQLSVLEQHMASANQHTAWLLDATVEEKTVPPLPERKLAFETATDGPHPGGVPPAAAIGLAGLAAIAPGPVMAGYAGAAILRTAVDMVSLFRVNTDYKNFDLTIDDAALAAEFKAVLPAGWKLWHPAMFPVNTIVQHYAAASPFLSLLEKLEGKNKEGATLLHAVNDMITGLTDALAKETDPGKKQRLQGRLNELSSCPDVINTLNNAYTQLKGMLATADPTSHATLLTTLLRAERLTSVLKDGSVYFVKLAAVSKGSNKVSQRLWSSAVIRHSAGTELNCLVFAPDGEVVFSDTQLKYTPYVKSEEIRTPL
ncbi:hypothetical protein Q4E93_21325 [Flavitalea sp. BT771]|uniref:hypothetical protein n=1 Tax=Flavitalea sp. BT771 TaxID=3063329 RepID=UPI0026E30B6E|nr:hypothetical protein [Flavitalea sp. BT771]MDO6433165.1 hypothetical protein [Flavitalea sp. BT771]MDV6221559.1 hypothetical protein [Flavitalea sp. BT771]